MAIWGAISHGVALVVVEVFEVVQIDHGDRQTPIAHAPGVRFCEHNGSTSECLTSTPRYCTKTLLAIGTEPRATETCTNAHTAR